MKYLLAVLSIVSLFTAVGCENTSGKVTVSGSVLLGGTPLDKGTITFLAPEGQTPTAATPIENGKFKLPAVSGLLPGKYRVRISAIEEFDITPEEYAAGKKAPPNRERVPAKYNTESQEMIDVDAKGKNQFDFDLK